MKKIPHVLMAIAAGAMIVPGGCNVRIGGGGGNPGTPLLTLTRRTIPQGQALAFTFTPEAGGEVTISVQADTDSADPDFTVVLGEVDFADLSDVPFGDVVMISDNEDGGQEIGRFTPDVAEIHTLFVTDAAHREDARFSITVTQR